MLKTIVTSALCILYASCLTAQSIRSDTAYNFGFEHVRSNDTLPDKWRPFFANKGYKCQTTTAEKHSGSRSLLMEQVEAGDARSFASIVEDIPAKFIGKTVEFKAWMKLENVSSAAALVIRVDNGLLKMVEFQTLQKLQINGTKDWAQYTVKASIPIDAHVIHVATLLTGSGKLWVDDAQVLIDGVDIAQAKMNPDYNPHPIPYGSNPAAGKTVKLKDATLYYEVYGSGQPMLLLHGNSQSIYAFNFQIGDLAKKYKVIAVDTRGQGKSIDETTGPLSYDLFADDMKQLLDSLHLKKVNILGWSDGGNTGLIMAEKYPAYVNKLATMGANLFPTTEALPDTVLNQVRMALGLYKSRKDARSLMQARLFTMLLQEPHLSFEEIKKIKAPTLIMAGEHDLILEKHTRAIAAAIPGAQLVIFNGATHYAPVEIIKEFNRTVLAFFAR